MTLRDTRGASLGIALLASTNLPAQAAPLAQAP